MSESKDSAASRTSGMRIDSALVRELAELLAETGLTEIEVEDGEPLRAKSVVLATGGLLSGGIVYQPSHAIPSEVLPPRSRVSFRTGLEVAGTLGADGRSLERLGSLFGAPPRN